MLGFTADVDLATGLNFLSLPAEPETPFTSYTLLSFITGCTKLARWRKDLQSYDEVQDGVGEEFGITLAEGYRISVSSDTTCNFTGTLHSTPTPVDLKKGLNLVSVPDTTKSFTSYDLFTKISGLQSVSRWDEGTQSYQTALKINETIIGDDFPIELGKSYFVKVSSDSTWSGE